MPYFIGQTAVSSVTFLAGVTPTNPTSVILTITNPDTTQTVITTGFSNPVAGVYSYDFILGESGVYSLQWVGSGNGVTQTTYGTIYSGSSTFPPVSPIDLCTIAQVKSFAGITDDQSDDKLQLCVTSAATYWLWRTGRQSNNGQLQTQSSLNSILSFNEWYDGNGNFELFLRQTPVSAVSLLTVNTVTIPSSNASNVPGYVIDSHGKSLVMRSPGQEYGQMRYMTSRIGSTYSFARGRQNVNVQYSAGFNGTPFDVQEKCIEMVALNYRRFNWQDQRSNTKPESMGTVTYRDWELTPGIVSVMESPMYNRRAAV